MTMRDQIIHAAETRLRSDGYSAVSFRELASDVGVKSASIHYHFPHKEDLGVAVVTAYSEKVLKALQAIDADASPREKLTGYIQVFRRALTKDRAICLCAMLGAEARGLPDKVKQAVQEFFVANINWLDDAMQGAAKYPGPAEIISTLEGAMLLANAMNDTAVFEEAAAGLLGRVE